MMCSRSFTLGLVACLCALAVGCGGDEAPEPVDSFCTEGTKTCAGNYLATCIDGGKAFKLSFCGESRFCSTKSGAAQCKSTACEKGALSCDGKKVVECPADGSTPASPLKTCGAGDKCLGGSCVPEKCTDGDMRCGWRRVLACKGGAWKVTKCSGKDICSANKCVPRSCTPAKAQCKSESEAQVCNVTGSGWNTSSCKAGDKCYDGICHREVKGGSAGGTVADGGGGKQDAGSSGKVDVPGFLDVGKKETSFEEPDEFSVIIHETPNPPSSIIPKEFTILSAQFLDQEKTVQISADEGLFKLEIHVGKLEEFQTGTFTAVGGEAEDSTLLMNDGTTDQSQVQWKYQSTDYSITITDFEGVDGRIKGKFSAEMGDATKQGAKIYLVDGKFNIKRSQ